MTPWLQDADVTLYHGDALAVLRELPAESVDCCVTSPPYWGLRDYGTGAWDGGDENCDHLGVPFRTKSKLNENWGAGFSDVKNTADREPMGQTCGKCGATRIDQQLGLEPTPEEYVTRMVEVFREVRRVLAAHGTVWLNLGDSYAGSWSGNSMRPEGGEQREGGPGFQPLDERVPARSGNVPTGLKPKDLVGIPWRVAFALQADGWYLRSDIIWAKPNPMPESVTDRPTKAHEYVFLLSKQPRYFFDQEAVREQFEMRPQNRFTSGENWKNGGGSHRRPDGASPGLPAPQVETLDDSEGEAPRGPDGRRNTHVEAADGSIQHRDGERWPNGGRNIRSVWEIATQPYPEAHFATFPEELARRCVAAGTSERGKCPECGIPWIRQVVTTYDAQGRTTNGPRSTERRHESPGRDVRMVKEVETTGWHPRCPCGFRYYDDGLTPPTVPCVVLDPFIGSGTVAHVARKLGRHAVGIDLSEEYLKLAARRLQQQSLFAEPAA